LPADQALGYAEAISDLSAKLCEITGYDAMSMQPNSGAQGEYAGLLTILAYHRARGDTQPTVCLIPTSAHGTNPASAQMAGMEVVVVKSAPNGDVDVEDFRAKAEAAGDRLAACMITYPSTHGVFEETVREICKITHDHGGQVYIDGANMNALVGLVKPGEIGGDVSHLNLHKTFAIPHGGGGPGMGPIGVKAHLAPICRASRDRGGRGAGFGGALRVGVDPADLLGLLPDDGRAGADAGDAGGDPERELHRGAAPGAYPILFMGNKGRVAHECILDTRPFAEAGVTVDDIAKRLIDNGFHAPTMSWPVAGTLMVEPTEARPRPRSTASSPPFWRSATRSARSSGARSRPRTPLRHAPHTVEDLVADWDRKPTAREQGCFPPGAFRVDKYWPPVGRVDNVYGDRNLICTCPPVEILRRGGGIGES
jgi:glycine dehydrogenase